MKVLLAYNNKDIKHTKQRKNNKAVKEKDQVTDQLKQCQTSQRRV